MAIKASTRASDIPMKSTIAVAVTTALTGHTGVAVAQSDSAIGIEEIVVSARKREESLQDIGASIQAITGEDLKRQGIMSMTDVVRFLPSVSSIGAVPGGNKIIFRGVSDNPNAFIAASSAALYLDEQPLTQFAVNPEPRLVDIKRVEALAGPQGTLYGDRSQSGTLRIITNTPNPNEFSAGADVMVRTGSDSDTSYDVNGYVNLPLVEDKFAIRLVGFTAKDGGFIDNVPGTSVMLGGKNNASLVQDDINNVDFSGGRIAAKWFINDDWAATVALISQKSEAEGSSIYDPTIGDLQNVLFFKDIRDDEWSQVSLTLEGSIGSIDIVSNTSYFEREVDYSYDRSTYAAYWNYNICPSYTAYCWSGETLYDQDTLSFSIENLENERFTQELRLSQTGDNYRWVLGAFYEKKTEFWAYRAVTPEFVDTLSYAYWTNIYEPSGVDPSWWLSADDTEWDQWAVFGNFNYDFNEQWSLEVGLRYFDQEMDRLYFVDKPFIIAPGVWPDLTNPQGGNSDVVPKVVLTYNIDDERMLYALYSEGFRAGGANRNRVPEEFTALPLVYEPDKLKNYELGFKSRWADGRVQLNATLFYGQWEDYQIETVDPSFLACVPPATPATDPCGQPFQVMVANVGDAEQLGLELDLKAAPSDNFSLGFNMTYVEAETSEDFLVNLPVAKGTRLPNVPEFKYSAFLQYIWPTQMLSGSDIYVRGQYTYQSDSFNQLEDYEAEELGSARGRFLQPSFGIGDLRAGIRSDAWTFEAFINNVTDERAVLYNDDLFFDPFFGKRRVTTNRPREYGIRMSYGWR